MKRQLKKWDFDYHQIPKVDKDGSIMVFRKNGFQYEKHIYIKYIWSKQPNRQGQTLGMHKELATKILPMDFEWRLEYGWTQTLQNISGQLLSNATKLNWELPRRSY
jgi:hypothetical protein